VTDRTVTLILMWQCVAVVNASAANLYDPFDDVHLFVSRDNSSVMFVRVRQAT